MKIFLTGGTGFIGSHLLQELLNWNHEVIAVRRPFSEPVFSLKTQPIWLDRSSLHLQPSDLEGVDVIIHLASAGLVLKKLVGINLRKLT